MFMYVRRRYYSKRIQTWFELDFDSFLFLFKRFLASRREALGWLYVARVDNLFQTQRWRLKRQIPSYSKREIYFMHTVNAFVLHIIWSYLTMIKFSYRSHCWARKIRQDQEEIASHGLCSFYLGIWHPECFLGQSSLHLPAAILSQDPGICRLVKVLECTILHNGIAMDCNSWIFVELCKSMWCIPWITLICRFAIFASIRLK